MVVHPGRGRERGRVQPLRTCHTTGSWSGETEESSPLLETALIAYELRPVFLSHERDPISAAQGIHKAGFLCPPACTFILRDRVELLLAPAPFDA